MEKANQLTLPLFDNEKAEKSFELNFTSKTKTSFGSKQLGRDVYIRRVAKGQIEFGKVSDKDYTFVYINEFNMCGQQCFCLFRFLTDGKPSYGGDVVMPEIQNLPKERLIEFIENVIQRHENDAFGWDYVNRCRLYTCAVN